jgi:hypothetical protein
MPFFGIHQSLCVTRQHNPNCTLPEIVGGALRGGHRNLPHLLRNDKTRAYDVESVTFPRTGQSMDRPIASVEVMANARPMYLQPLHQRLALTEIASARLGPRPLPLTYLSSSIFTQVSESPSYRIQCVCALSMRCDRLRLDQDQGM